MFKSFLFDYFVGFQVSVQYFLKINQMEHLALPFILISAKNRGDQEIVVGSLIFCVLKYDPL